MINIGDVEGLIEKMDIDGDGMIDIMEFTESMESLDDHDDTLDEDAKPKEFPSPMQRRMMSKSWNDTFWPLIHTAFGIMIVLLLVNALLGPVDGSGGMVEYVAKDSTTIVMTDDGTLGDQALTYWNSHVTEDNLLFIRNGIDSTGKGEKVDHTSTLERFSETGDAPILLMVSRLAGWKRIDRGIDLVSDLRGRYSSTKLIVVGDGEQKELSLIHI